MPLQRHFLHVPVRSAIANSSGMIIGLSIVGAAAKHIGLALHHPDIRWYQPAALAILLIPTAMLGASIGARLTHRLDVQVVRVTFALLLFIAGGRMCYRAM